MPCRPEDVDDVIRHDFESMPSHLFHDKYRDMLTKYAASLSGLKSNTALSYISSARSFFSNEAISIKLQAGKLPRPEMAMGEHRFTLNELRKMWLIADTEGKARLSVAVSLGWSVSDFLSLTAEFIQNVVGNKDIDGFAAFDYRRMKTKTRIRGVLNANTVHDLEQYLARVPAGQEYLWTTHTKTGINYWLRRLFKEAGLQAAGSLRFHLVRKYVYDLVSSQCGVNEAKLLTGKTIPLSDETYLHGLEARLLERYKRFAYPFLRLGASAEAAAGIPEKYRKKIEDLEGKYTSLIDLYDETKNERNELWAIVETQQDEMKHLHSLIESLQDWVKRLTPPKPEPD